MASIYKVRCKDKFLKEEVDPMLLTTLDDFTLSNSSSSSLEGPQHISDPADFVRQHGAQFSVYSVDFDRRVLGMVRVRKGVNVNRAPFFFQAQRESAEELLLIPFDELPAVVEAV
ncbi:Hypp4623 [Branchiostoma lanceolatum]|uniref:Hypp4623 protein n=1 Tax=Branchiostoma lanceolatum TaxID=7740 RepID=A0A8K0A9J1_BRALA|nr:Hypp4623 [Branchiostoma lanceolatum]